MRSVDNGGREMSLKSLHNKDNDNSYSNSRGERLKGMDKTVKVVRNNNSHNSNNSNNYNNNNNNYNNNSNTQP